MTLLGIVAILAGFTLLIVIHELGHYFAARWAGIRADGFAVGMGPTALSWRRGVGLVAGSTDRIVRARHGRSAIELSDEELRRHGLGETEWSLRWLPIGGFVKMLGQEDLRPVGNDTSERSYASVGVGKRMVVVSAGVIANALLAVVLFMIAFLVGVRFPAPVIGDTFIGLPAATASASNAAALGVSEAGLLPGDRVLAIDGEPARTFDDLMIAAAMSPPNTPLQLAVERPGVATPLEFSILPAVDPISNLLSIGVAPASSTRLDDHAQSIPFLEPALTQTGLEAAGVTAGMQLTALDGAPVSTWEEFDRVVRGSAGRPVMTRWVNPDVPGSAAIDVPLLARASLDALVIPAAAGESDAQDRELGLLGLTPRARIESVPADSDNRNVLRAGDIVLRAGDLVFPRAVELRRYFQARPRQSVAMVVLRDGAEVEVTASLNRRGQIGVVLGYDLDNAVISRPVDRLVSTGDQVVASPIADAALIPGSRIDLVGTTPVANWAELRQALRQATADAASSKSAATVALTVTAPTPGAVANEVAVTLAAADVERLHALGWGTPLGASLFEPVMVRLSAEGNPLRAVGMGFSETRKLIVMTYLTIYRLMQRTVGVEQLRGPVGIVHLGSQVVDQGWAYLVLFLAMISINLAVLNFLPLPIVDGGLFLYLVYEKVKGKAPPAGFQNAATLVGLCLLAGIFLVTFYNDVMRLFG